MKAAFLAEFSAFKNVLLQSFVLYLVIGLIIGITLGSAVAAAACVASMAPILLVFTFSGYDNMNGWERFRATLPVSREALVMGRYLNVLVASLATMVAGFLIALAIGIAAPALPLDTEILASIEEEVAHPLEMAAGCIAGSCLMLMFASLFQPFILRFGLTKALRWIPTGIFLLFFLAVTIAPQFVDMPNALVDLLAFASDPGNIPTLILAICAITLGVYALSYAGAVVLYRTKEL